MKPFLLLLIFSWFSCILYAQTFTTAGGAIPGQSGSSTCYNNTVSGVGLINSTYGLSQVCININHPYDDELEIVLTAPDGTIVPLTIQNGGSGNNYTGTCFSATAVNPIKFGTAPFTGSFLPEGHLGAMNNGQNANGVWKLCIQDRRNSGNAGTLVNWSLTFNNTPAAQPPSLPGCTTILPSTSSCSTAGVVCDFNGLCGSTSGSTVQDWPGSGLNGSCFGLQNNSFIKFVASSTTASFSVWVPSSSNTFNNGGIQMLFFSGTCNSGAVTTYGCYPHILPYSSPGNPLITVVAAAGLTPGNTYYLMIDGFNNDNCTFTIAANTGINILNISPTAPDICTGGSVPLTATGGNGTFTWSPALGLSATSGAVVTASPAATITYTVTSSTATSCPITKNVTVTVNPLPPAPVLTVTNTCGTATLTVTGATGTLTWSDGGTGNPRTVTTAGSFSVTQTIGTCTSAASNIVTAAPVAVPLSPTAAITQPTCSTTTGSIVVSAPIGANLEYSINGSTYQASKTFNSVTAGNYNITVRDKVTTCVSPSVLSIINMAPLTPATPIAIIKSHPVCSSPTGGTIVITGPTGNDLEYSINNGSYQANNVFTGLTGGNYTLVVRYFGSNCLSQPITLNIKPLDPLLCGDDIYFPSVFTPNGDGTNDGFGPGPLSNLANVSAYNLSIYNRYGEKVFSSNDPYQKWNGTFKGSSLANYNYVWQARYKIAGSTTKFKKGTILIIK